MDVSFGFFQFECFLFFIVANIINIKYIFYTLFVDWGKKENKEWKNSKNVFAVILKGRLEKWKRS